ncbi:MAG: AAA family ATPase [Candidatus Latescibacterota bacterium]
MKVAITGKGGVGKTTLGAGLATLFARGGARVIAVDADPDSNLAATLGFPEPGTITPLCQMQDLIAERTGARAGAPGALFTLNPKVDDIPETYCPKHDGIRLVVMGGGGRGGGSGCLCPENAFLRAFMAHLVFGRQDVVIMDMEAGVEHLTRGTARGVEALLVVVEPGQRSVETAGRIRRLAGDLGIANVVAVANKVRGEADRAFLQQQLADLEIAAFIPYADGVVQSGMGPGGIAAALDGPVGQQIGRVQRRLEELVGSGDA